MTDLSRRQFAGNTLSALLTYSLLETLFTDQALADQLKPVAAQWIKDLNELGSDLKGNKLEQVAWQKQVEKLMARVNLPDLLKFIDFEKRQQVPFRDKGERSIRFKFPEVEGLPTNLVFGHQIFKLKKGQSVVPHGHNNMATAFLVLDGKFQGRLYDRLEDTDEHMIIRPTVDQAFSAGDCSTISDKKDNVHWFEASSDQGYIFNIHVLNLNSGLSGRIYIDPNGEKLANGLVKARRIDAAEAIKLYG
jgi:hypothetical protein